MATFSVLDFCTLSNAHSAPKSILEMTHFFDKKWEKTVNFQFFSFLFDKKFLISTKFYENSTKLYEKLTNIHEKLTKIHLWWFFPHFLLKKKKYGFQLAQRKLLSNGKKLFLTPRNEC